MTNTALNHQLLLRYTHVSNQLEAAQANHADQGVINVMQEEQEILFASLSEETQREVLTLAQIREFERRLEMQTLTQYCPYHDESFKMLWNGEVSYTQDSAGNITGAYRNIECPHCGNTEQEGVRPL